MKAFILGLALVTTSNVFAAGACPILTGSYVSCTTGNATDDRIANLSSKLNIDQLVTGSFVSYEILEPKDRTVVIVGDKVSSKKKIENVNVTFDIGAACKANKLVLDYTLKSIAFPASTSQAERNMTKEIMAEMINGSTSTYSLVGSTLTIVDKAPDGSLNLKVTCKKQ